MTFRAPDRKPTLKPDHATTPLWRHPQTSFVIRNQDVTTSFKHLQLKNTHLAPEERHPDATKQSVTFIHDVTKEYPNFNSINLIFRGKDGMILVCMFSDMWSVFVEHCEGWQWKHQSTHPKPSKSQHKTMKSYEVLARKQHRDGARPDAFIYLTLESKCHAQAQWCHLFRMLR